MTNKTEAPARIWASTGLYYDYVTDWSEGEWYAGAGDGVPYIRADLSDAKDASIAELEAKLEKAVATLEYFDADLADRNFLLGSPYRAKARATLAELKGTD